MKKSNYVTVFSLFDFSKRKRKNGLNCIKIIFAIFFTIYIATSIATVFFNNVMLIELLLNIGNILSVAVSILISLIAIIISNSYNEEIISLLNGIIDTNEPLGLNLKSDNEEQNSKFDFLKILFVINLIIICILFVLSSCFQIITLYIKTIDYVTDASRILTFTLTVAVLTLNFLSIFDCIKTSNKHKKTIMKIEKINNQIFESYNRNKVDSLKK